MDSKRQEVVPDRNIFTPLSEAIRQKLIDFCVAATGGLNAVLSGRLLCFVHVATVFGFFQQQSNAGLSLAAGMTAEADAGHDIDKQQEADKQDRTDALQHFL